MLKAGAAIIDISPKPGVPLSGYPNELRPNVGVHNPICASALYLFDGKTPLMIINTELLYIGKTFVKAIRREFPELTLIFTATHTHCGPCAYDALFLCDEEYRDDFGTKPAYADFLMAQLRTVIKEAMANSFTATLGFTNVQCGPELGIGGNRHSPTDIADTRLGVLAVKDEAGEVRFIMATYALHPTLLHEDCVEVTGDYPSYIRRFLSFAHPKAVFGFAQGCSGDQSTRYFRVAQNFEEAARVGTTFGVEIFHAIEKMSFTDNLPISYVSEEITLPYKNFPAPEEAERLLRVAQEEYEAVKNEDFLTAWNAKLRLFGAESTVRNGKLVASGYNFIELPFEIGHITLGDYHILVCQGELFVAIGIAIKNLLPGKEVFFFETSNGGTPGYVYTKEGVVAGDYEAGQSIFREDACDILIDAFRKLLNK